MDTQDLIKTVDEITRAMGQCKTDRDRKRCRAGFAVSSKAFATTYPKLFEICCDERFEREQFDFLIAQFAQVRDHQVSFEAGTSNVTEHLNNKYIIPLVGAPQADVDTAKMEHIRFTSS